jgi:2-C-methyl-D-erythritol 4-phosphate cytidylyltransferase
VVIPAGGRGVRFGGKSPKQFQSLQGKTVLHRCIALFESVNAVHEIVVVAPAKHMKRVRDIIARARFRKVTRVVIGGRERQESVWNGLHAFTKPPDIVLVHDAVRPFVTEDLVRDVIRQAIRYGAAVVGTPIRDTVKVEGRKRFFTRTLDRANLWTVQTPQGFRYSLLLDAHKAARRTKFRGTDEASLVEQLGVPVRIAPGDERNLKITTRDDLEMAKLFLKRGFRAP